LFAAMVDERLADLSNVSQLLTGGDVVSPPHARKVLEAYPHLVLINGYGPTENTTFTSCHRMLTTADVGNPVPIGRAIPNTRVYVLDKHLRPMAIGANGELYAAGDGLARDYRNRPSLTASRFIPDPLALQPGERMYTVGDTVRFRRDGTLEFFGRLDDQAKVRGFRVEAGELEAVLNAQPSVRGCVAIIQRDPETKEASLVAYVVPEDAAQFDEAAMLAMLEATVPAFLVPSAIIPLPVIPLTANGKLDRRRLPAAGAKRVEAQADRVHVEPNTDAQHKIAAIWREVLNVERVSVQDDFFELGGHSLSALRVVSRMRKVFGVEVPLPDIFTAPTIALLAAAIETREGHAPSARPLVRRERVAVTLDAPSE
jgi:acyl-coenzyme A synthetase/AMP-(fatty) acid ligase/acyl carrier protein